MKHDITLNAPSYAPDAIPTEGGWKDAKTGELLVAVKLDMTKFQSKKKGPVDTPVVTEAPSAELTKEVVTEAPSVETVEDQTLPKPVTRNRAK